jgi:hypothetical protein
MFTLFLYNGDHVNEVIKKLNPCTLFLKRLQLTRNKLSKRMVLSKNWNGSRGHSSAFCCRFYQYGESDLELIQMFFQYWVGDRFHYGVPLTSVTIGFDT